MGSDTFKLRIFFSVLFNKIQLLKYINKEIEHTNPSETHPTR